METQLGRLHHPEPQSGSTRHERTGDFSRTVRAGEFAEEDVLPVRQTQLSIDHRYAFGGADQYRLEMRIARCRSAGHAAKRHEGSVYAAGRRHLFTRCHPSFPGSGSPRSLPGHNR